MELQMRKLLSKRPPGFDGQNFMTRDVLGYYKLRVGYAELSEGRGMSNQPIFGVTVRPDQWEEGKQARSRLFQSRSAALNYIDELSE
jgi:hypothetical protein